MVLPKITYQRGILQKTVFTKDGVYQRWLSQKIVVTKELYKVQKMKYQGRRKSGARFYFSKNQNIVFFGKNNYNDYIK